MRSKSLIYILRSFSFVIIFMLVSVGNILSEGPGNQDGRQAPNTRKKETSAKRLVRKAELYLKKHKHSISEACHEFTNNSKDWRRGEEFVFVIGMSEDEAGVIFTMGDDLNLIWSNIRDTKEVMGTSLIDKFNSLPVKGGWVIFPLHNTLLHAYVKIITSNNKKYAIGSGFYPEEAEYQVRDLVRRAIETLNDKHTTLERAFTLFNNPYGLFVNGPSYIFIVDQDGIIKANGDARGALGQSFYEFYENEPAVVNQVKKFSQSKTRSTWLNFQSAGDIATRAYLEKYTQPDTQKTFIVGSLYYPDVNEDTVFSLVQKAIAYLKAEGLNGALGEFNKRTGPFAIGGMNVFLVDFNGIALADPGELDLVGRNLSKRIDEKGNLPTKKLLDEVLEQGQMWTSERHKNANKLIYAEKVLLSEGAFMIGSGFWPSSKAYNVKTMVDRAVSLVRQNGRDISMQVFSSLDPDFLRGDVMISAYDKDGIKLVDGPFKKFTIWTDMDLRDTKGQRVVNQLLSMASEGGGWVNFNQFNARYRAYVQQVDLRNPDDSVDPLILVSGYYR